MRSMIGLLVFGWVLVPAVARGDEPPDYQTRRELTLRTRDIFQRYCSECHTGVAEPGQSKRKLMDHADVLAKADVLLKKGSIALVDPSGTSLLLDLVKDGSMPPANRPAPSAEEITVLERWVKANAPAYPVAFNEQYVLGVIDDDLDRQKNDAKATPGRYVSLAHLVRQGDQTRGMVAAIEAEESALQNALSPGADQKARALLTPIDPAATVFRVDVDRLKWLTDSQWTQMEAGKAGGAFRLTPFDLLLLEYPFARSFAPKDLPPPRVEKLFGDQVRPVAYLQSEWVRSALRDEKEPTALAHDLEALLALTPGATDQDGPVAKPFAGQKPVTTRAGADGRAPVAPLSAWYLGDIAPEKPPFGLRAEVVVDGKPVTQVKVDEPFALRVSCDKNAFFMLLQVQADGEVRVQKVQDGTVLQANRPRLLTPNGVGISISGITTGGDAAVEHFVLFVSEKELPVPTILRSKHADKHIWRFIMAPTEKYPFDPNAVVRKVIPIKVTKK